MPSAQGKLFDHLIEHPPRDIDLLFLESTMLYRNNDQFPDETAVGAHGVVEQNGIIFANVAPMGQLGELVQTPTVLRMTSR